MERTKQNILFNNKGKITRQVVFSLIVLLSGFFLGVYIIGPVFRSGQESMPEEKLSLKGSDINAGKAEDYVSQIKSLQTSIE